MPVAQKLSCRVESVVDHGDHVYTVTLRPERPAPKFRAGQFLHLALDSYDPTRFWPESRVFSIASSPSDRDRLRISYSVRGTFTTRMEAELVEGRNVWIKMPYGDFVVNPHSDAVLLAGGTGITAFTAFVESLTPDHGPSVCLAYGVRAAPLFIYRDLVEGAARTVPSLETVFFVEGGERPQDGDGRLEVHAGRVSVDAVWPRLRHALDADYYISGPPAMLQTLARDLRARGIADNRIHIDAWE